MTPGAMQAYRVQVTKLDTAGDDTQVLDVTVEVLAVNPTEGEGSAVGLAIPTQTQVRAALEVARPGGY